MSFAELADHRHSCRAYLKQAVERDKIIACLEAARLAPSACNSQPWRFVAVDDPEQTRLIAGCVQSEVLGLNRFAGQVPVFVVVVEEPARLTEKLGSVVKNQTYASMDIGLATANFCLAATDQGLGTCIIGWFAESRIRRLLNIPQKRRIRLVIALGYPAAAARPHVRKPAAEVYRFNRY
jgi:nitroreductase